MNTYADTGLLFSLYSTDAHSSKADVWRHSNPFPLPFTLFHRLELHNALHLAAFQHRLTQIEIQSTWHEVQNDLAAGLLIASDALWPRLLANAETFAVAHTSTIGCRTLDILHVEAAKEAGATRFCTFDARQAALALKPGMSVTTP